ncbi:MAG: paraquat-inducible protein A [Thermodesulfobacteriota bacterium]
MSLQQLTAAEVSLISCHACNKLHPLESFADLHEAFCLRCGAKLHMRIPNSISKTWALVITAAIFYIPANIYPVMTVHALGTGDPHTIIGGVEALFNGGQWPLAFLVFFASIFVPLMKIMGIIYLLLSVQLGWAKNPKQKTSLYRIVEVVGKWSMIDIFMISILVALVQLGAVADIVAGKAATFFSAVVVMTMLAAMSFDPRLIWDTANEKNKK